MEDYTEIVLPTQYLFHLHHLLLGIRKERMAYVRALPGSRNVFPFYFDTKSFFYKGKGNVFSKLDYTNSDISSCWSKSFVRAVITLAPCSGWEAQIPLLILISVCFEAVFEGATPTTHHCFGNHWTAAMPSKLVLSFERHLAAQEPNWELTQMTFHLRAQETLSI